MVKKKCLVGKNFSQNILWKKNLLKDFSSKKISVRNDLAKKILSKKFGRKNVVQEKFFGQKNDWCKKFLSKMIFGKKEMVRNVLNDSIL